MGWKAIPSAPEQTESRNWLMDLMNRKIPQRQIAGMTSAESTGQELLNEYLGKTGMGKDYSAGMDVLRDTVAGNYDPSTSQYYQGYRNSSKQAEGEAVDSLRRRAELSGIGASTPALDQEGDIRQGFVSDRMMYLGSLINAERNNQLNAAGQLMQGSEYAENQPLRQATAAMQLGGLERNIEQNIYDSVLEQALSPYMYQVPIANQILQEPRFVYKSKSGGGGLGGALGSMASSFLGSDAGSGLLAGGLSALTGGIGSLFSGAGGLWAGGNAAPGLGGTMTSAGSMFA